MARRCKRDPNQPWYHRYLIAAIRKVWRYSPAKRQARKLAAHPTKKDKKGRPHQRCATDSVYHPYGDTQVDHIQPAVSVTGFVDWNTLIKQCLDAKAEDLQILCKVHHKEKTNKENEQRRENKQN